MATKTPTTADARRPFIAGDSVVFRAWLRHAVVVRAYTVVETNEDHVVLSHDNPLAPTVIPMELAHQILMLVEPPE